MKREIVPKGVTHKQKEVNDRWWGGVCIVGVCVYMITMLQRVFSFK